jgi:hypothetical protein
MGCAARLCKRRHRRQVCAIHHERCRGEDHDRLRCWLGLLALLGLFVYPLLLLLRWWRQLQHLKPPHPGRFTAPITPACQNIPPHIYRRPDPMIYDQRYLMSQGLAVTWINPDVAIEQAGVPVDPSSLTPSTSYDVVARIWNGSTNAPAIGLPVDFSYLSFGVGTQKHPIGTTHVNLGAKGAPGCPTFATQSWTTPAAPGHYCLLIELVWPDDANPLNNVGQSNTDVKKLNSPHAAFAFDAENTEDATHTYRFAVDAYALPQRPGCGDQPPAKTPVPNDGEIRARVDAVRKEHDPAAFPVPDDWMVTVEPSEVQLEGGATREVTVDVTAPDGFAGSKQFNVNAFDERGRLVGGVSLIVES